MNSRHHLAEGERIAGTKYRVIRLIGSGGMGSVYEVEHEELGKRFVLKTLLRELSNREDLVQRLRTEWRALGKLEHPNIVRVSDAGVADGTLPYFVMERLTGETLASRLATRRQLPLSEALAIGIAVLDALSVAHSIGIIHRDVKPPNIFLTTQEVPKLLDFGIAKLLDASAESITARGVAVGTPRYMSPEQAAGDVVDARADLYAVGLVLYEMITGSGPYSAADANELFLAHLTQTAPPLSTRVPGVSLEIDALVATLLAKSPAERPSGAKAAADALRAARALLKPDATTPRLKQAAGKREAAPPQVPPPGHAASLSGAATTPASQVPTVAVNVLGAFDASTKSFAPVSLAVTRPQGAERTQRISEPPPSADAAATRTAFLPRGTVGEDTQPLPARASSEGAAPRGRWIFPVAVLALAALAVSLARPSKPTPAAAAKPTLQQGLAAVATTPSAKPSSVSNSALLAGALKQDPQLGPDVPPPQEGRVASNPRRSTARAADPVAPSPAASPSAELVPVRVEAQVRPVAPRSAPLGLPPSGL